MSNSNDYSKMIECEGGKETDETETEMTQMTYKDSKFKDQYEFADTFFDNVVLFLSVQAMIVYVYYAFKYSGFDPFSANILGGAISFFADIVIDLYLACASKTFSDKYYRERAAHNF